MKIARVVLWLFVLGVLGISFLLWQWQCSKSLCSIDNDEIVCWNWQSRSLTVSWLRVDGFDRAGYPDRYAINRVYFLRRKNQIDANSRFRRFKFHKTYNNYYWWYGDDNDSIVYSDTLPIRFQPGEWYLIKGPTQIDRYVDYYYFTVDSAGNVVPKFKVPKVRGSGPMGLKEENPWCACG